MNGHWAIPVLASILILGSLGFSQQSFAQIPPGFSDFGGHCYGETAPSDWPTAEAEAVTFGGHLVTINDAAENAFVFSTFGGGPWIGYNDIAVEGTFVWVSGIVTGGYENWAAGEPTGDADFVHMQGDATWNDISTFTPGVIELDVTCAAAFGAIGGTSIPIDTTALLLAGTQSISMWMIPVVVASIVIGVFVIKRKN